MSAAAAAGSSASWKKQPSTQRTKPFIIGAMAGCTATSVIQPIDMVKVRLQNSGEMGSGPAVRSPFRMAGMIYRNEGMLAFYKGLSAALLRQCTYGMARLGIFSTANDMLKSKEGRATASGSFIAGILAGGLGSMFGTPADLALIRMQADATLPPEKRRNYRNVIDALRQIARQEGVLNLWKGNLPTMTRAIALNVGMLTTNELIKQRLEKMDGFGKSRLTVFTSSMCAGFFASFFSLPFDFVKTRIQKQARGADGKMPYAGSIDCVVKVARTEGMFAFYKGFSAYYVRIAPHAVITLVMLEYINKKATKAGF